MKYLLNVSTLEYDEKLCTGCRRCNEVCPHGVFEMKHKKAFITDKDHCIECGACQKNCESNAIRVKTGVGCSAAILYSIFTGNEATCGCDDNSSSSGSSCC